MNVTHLINQAIYKNKETITESICLLYPNLLHSNNHKSILIPLYNVNNYNKLFKLIEVTSRLAQIHTFSRIFFATSGKNNYHTILSRFKHISGIFKAQRLLQLEKILSFMDITKIYYPFDPELETLHAIDTSTLYTINIYHEDIARAIKFIGTTKDLLLISCNNKSKIISKHNDIKTPYILFTEKYLPHIKVKQITHEGYIYKNIPSRNRRRYFIHNPNIAISIALGLMFQHQYVKIDDSNNLFDYLHHYTKYPV